MYSLVFVRSKRVLRGYFFRVRWGGGKGRRYGGGEDLWRRCALGLAHVLVGLLLRILAGSKELVLEVLHLVGDVGAETVSLISALLRLALRSAGSALRLAGSISLTAL